MKEATDRMLMINSWSMQATMWSVIVFALEICYIVVYINYGYAELHVHGKVTWCQATGKIAGHCKEQSGV